MGPHNFAPLFSKLYRWPPNIFTIFFSGYFMLNITFFAKKIHRVDLNCTISRWAKLYRCAFMRKAGCHALMMMTWRPIFPCSLRYALIDGLVVAACCPTTHRLIVMLPVAPSLTTECQDHIRSARYRALTGLKENNHIRTGRWPHARVIGLPWLTTAIAVNECACSCL